MMARSQMRSNQRPDTLMQDRTRQIEEPSCDARPDHTCGSNPVLGRYPPHFRLEPISKSPEEDNKAGELDKAEEVLGVVLPADEDATLPLYPSEETLDKPPSHITA